MSSSRRHTVPRQLYDLPQRQLEKIDRKLQHDGYNVGRANKLKMAIEELEKILMKLGHTTTVLPALKKSLLLDHSSLLNYFNNIKGNVDLNDRASLKMRF